MKASLTLAWNAFWTLKRRRDEPLWARLAVAAAIALVAGTLLMGASGLLTGRESDPGWWRASYLFNMGMSIVIAWSTVAMATLLERCAPRRWLERLGDPADWRAMLALSAALAAGVTTGCLGGLHGIGYAIGFQVSDIVGHPLVLARLYVLLAVVLAAAWLWWLVRLRQHQRQRALQLLATEAQLRLLQGQIEPHFLFNTLANVESLMDADPPRARYMLEAFTDYLRAGLTQMREGDSRLAAELDMAGRYLELMHIRMGARLAYRIDADETVRALRIPTLLLQPLIENAIHHGLENKVEGGTIAVSARLDGATLVLRVDDDGLGSTANGRPYRGQPWGQQQGQHQDQQHGPQRRHGAGMALANIRSRLQARYGARASLDLALRDAGASATLTLPVTPVQET